MEGFPLIIRYKNQQIWKHKGPRSEESFKNFLNGTFLDEESYEYIENPSWV